jgi:hypothetical protein
MDLLHHSQRLNHDFPAKARLSAKIALDPAGGREKLKSNYIFIFDISISR